MAFGVNPEYQETMEILKYFDASHLPQHLREVSEPICDIAHELADTLNPSDQLKLGLQKLLEAKDCFVRARLINGE